MASGISFICLRWLANYDYCLRHVICIIQRVRCQAAKTTTLRRYRVYTCCLLAANITECLVWQQKPDSARYLLTYWQTTSEICCQEHGCVLVSVPICPICPPYGSRHLECILLSFPTEHGSSFWQDLPSTLEARHTPHLDVSDGKKDGSHKVLNLSGFNVAFQSSLESHVWPCYLQSDSAGQRGCQLHRSTQICQPYGSQSAQSHSFLRFLCLTDVAGALVNSHNASGSAVL